jgi:AcrR family transcriptional regulator
MVDIAERASVSKGLLYVYFKNKEAMFESVINEVAREVVDRVKEFRLGPDEGVRDFMLRTGPPMIRDIQNSKRGALIRLVIAEGARFPAIAEIYDRVALQPMLVALRELAEVAFAKGELRSEVLVRFPMILALPALYGTVSKPLLHDANAPAPDLLFSAMVEAIFEPDRAGRKG